MTRLTGLALAAAILCACDGSTNKDMAEKSVARQDLSRAYSIFNQYSKSKNASPASRADLISYDGSFPSLVDYYKDGYMGISWAILARPWDDKIMLVSATGEVFILEKSLKF